MYVTLDLELSERTSSNLLVTILFAACFHTFYVRKILCSVGKELSNDMCLFAPVSQIGFKEVIAFD